MSDLNKKNINYGALNRFYQDLKSHDLSGLATEQYVDDAIENIHVTPITDVSVFPDAEENKDSVLRLNGDKQVYISKLGYDSSVNSPDSEQVGVAYVTDDTGEKLFYNGTEVTINASNGIFTGYAWLYEGRTISEVPTAGYFSTIKAAEIEDNTALFYTNAEVNYVSSTTFNVVGEQPGTLGTLSTDTMLNVWELIDGYYIKKGGVSWIWDKVVTKSELNILNESTFTGATLTVDGTQPSIVASGTTTIVWDDLAASIPSGKSVEVSVVVINTGNSALTPTMSGNVQMMGDGNITIQPNELGLYKAKYISAVDVWLVEAVNQEVQGMVS